MGTIADFYVGRGPKAEWIGSIAWDGYPDGIVAINDKGQEIRDYMVSKRRKLTLIIKGLQHEKWPNCSRIGDFGGPQKSPSA